MIGKGELMKKILEIVDNGDVRLRQKNVKKGEVLVREGEYSRKLYYIKEGILRLWHNNFGEEITLQFFFSGQFVSSFESYLYDRESKFTLESVSNSIIIELDREVLEELLEKNPEMKEEIYYYINNRFIDYIDLFLSRIKNSPQERYKELMEINPILLEKAPHYMIASYLGITPVSLSRIRRKFEK